MAGKSWPPCRREKAATFHTDKTVEREERTGKGKQPLSRVSALETQTLKKNGDQVKLLEHI